MNNPIKELISSSYECGELTKLNNLWNDYNIICPHNKLYYIVDGEFIIEINNTRYLCSKGDMVLIPAGIKHSYYLTQKEYAVKYWIHFNLKSDSVNFFSKYFAPFKAYIPLNNGIEQLFLDIFSLSKNSNKLSQLSISLKILQLVDIYIQNSSLSINEANLDAIDKLIIYIRNNYNDVLNLEQLSERTKLSTNHLIRKFKAKTGYSPIQYINHVRLETARFLIANTDDPILEIMEKVGIFDAAYFCKIFKKYYQHSPRKYRELYGAATFHLIHKKTERD